MTVIDDTINRLLTPEGRMQARLRITGGKCDVGHIQSSMSRAEYYMQMAKTHEKNGDKKEAKMNYRQAMISYERAGVFSMAQNVAEILGDREMHDVYHQMLIKL